MLDKNTKEDRDKRKTEKQATCLKTNIEQKFLLVFIDPFVFLTTLAQIFIYLTIPSPYYINILKGIIQRVDVVAGT